MVAAEKPHLDGRLDDAVWQRAKPVALRSSLHDDLHWPASVMLAHDDEFLYIAIRCRRPPGARYEAAAGPRVRKSDLSAHDRVDVLIDLDRDFATYYRLTIDHRGWTTTPVVATPRGTPPGTWPPVRPGTSGRPRRPFRCAQLSGGKPASAEAVWAIGLQRTVPGVGFQSWTTPAAAAILPEGFGYLLFERR